MASGLVGAWVFNEGCGSKFNNLADGSAQMYSAAIGTLTAPSWGSSANGSGYKTLTAGQGLWIAASGVSASLKPTDAISIYWRGQPQGAQGGNNVPLIAMWFDNAGGSPFLGWGLHRQSGDASSVSFFANKAGTFFQFNYTGAINTSAYGQGVTDFLSTYDRSSQHVLYRNGIKFGANTGLANGAMTYGATATLTAGVHITSAVDTINVINDVIYVWNRPLSGDAAATLHSDPFCILRGPDVWRRSVAMGA